MTKTKTHEEKTSAAENSLGFEFQYYYFLNAILNLKTGQAVGLEVKDDVHTQLDADRQILVQLKHTVKKSASGKPINLTELDHDLWKTLSNWAHVITDKAANRVTTSDHLSFVRKTEFQLASNKSISSNNVFINSILAYHEESIDITQVISYIGQLHEKTTDETIKTYIRKVLSLDATVLENFLKRISFELEIDDIIKQIKTSIKEKIVPPNRIQVVFERLDSNIRRDNFISITNRIPIIITFDQFNNKYYSVFEEARSHHLPKFTFQPVLSGKKFAAENFIQQLIKIEELNEHDDEQIIKYATEKIGSSGVPVEAPTCSILRANPKP